MESFSNSYHRYETFILQMKKKISCTHNFIDIKVIYHWVEALSRENNSIHLAFMNTIHKTYFKLFLFYSWKRERITGRSFAFKTTKLIYHQDYSSLYLTTTILITEWKTMEMMVFSFNWTYDMFRTDSLKIINLQQTNI